jgi:hypothetical protein
VVGANGKDFSFWKGKGEMWLQDYFFISAKKNDDKLFYGLFALGQIEFFFETIHIDK